ncbi:RDD family [Mycoplasmopsis maculosa]|uniref:RDD family n=1 Tax=Mycoplasmopsis maculosa TaxID=114885 RepID=A0A449B3L7_9BACT|nr:RDD family protein [Mycoplasmopsis maculosa]VEU75192.1 RDD family [Mycoplasmopsis maculosa]
MLHKNVSFWRRLFQRFIDIFLFFALIFISFYFIVIFNQKKGLKISSYYSFLIVSLFISLFYFLFIPLFYKLKTIGMLITNVQFILNNKTKNKIKYLFFIKRLIFTLFISIFIILIFLFFIYPSDLPTFLTFLSKRSNTKFKFLLVEKLISITMSILAFLFFADVLFLAVNKKKISIFDYLTQSRLVYIKHFNISKTKKTVLLPFKSKNVNFIINE